MILPYIFTLWFALCDFLGPLELIAECDIKEQIEAEKPHAVSLLPDSSVIINGEEFLPHLILKLAR